MKNQHLKSALNVFGYFLLFSMIIQLVNYAFIFGSGVNFGSNYFIISLLFSIFSSFAGAALHGAVGLLCIYASRNILDTKAG